MHRLCAILLLLFALPGCIQQIALRSVGGIMDNGFAVLNEESDLDIAEKSIATNLKLLESIMRSDPENNHYLLLASMGYASYALGFVEDDSMPRASGLYLRARDFGMKILLQNRTFRDSLEGNPDAFQAALRTFSKDDVPAIFWTAVSWGSYIAANLTEPAALADLGKVEAMMQFVVGSDPDYFYGGGHFFLGTLLGSRSKILGGDPDASLNHFQVCLRLNKGRFLMTYVYFARSYAVQTQNRELFEQCLTTVDTTSLNVLPEARLSNAVAKKKARLLRARIDELF